MIGADHLRRGIGGEGPTGATDVTPLPGEKDSTVVPLDPARAKKAPNSCGDLCPPFVETMMDGFAYCQMIYDEEGSPVDWIYLAINPAFVSLTGLENIVGKRVTEAIPDIKKSSPELFEIYGRVAAGGHPEKFEIDFTPLSMWLNVAVSSPAPGYFVAVFENITQRKRMEAALRLSQLSLDRSGDLIHWVAPDGRILYASDSSVKRLGYTREELLSLTVFDLVPMLTSGAWPARWREVRAHGSLTFESALRTKAGEVFPIEITVNYLQYDGNEYNFAFCRDISERRRLESSLRLTQLSVDRAADLIHWIAPDGRLLYVSDSACLRHGYSREELLAMTIFDLDPVLTRSVWDQQWREMKELGSLSFEAVHRTKFGEVFPVEVVVNYVCHENEEYNFGFARDISERKKAEQELQRAKAVLEAQNWELKQAGRRLERANQELVEARDALALQARTDPLTGCLNRAAVLARLDEELERLDREGGCIAVGMMDIDHFKQINDGYGHLAGDRVLREIVARALAAVRPYDLLGRFGGDEFLVVITGVGEEEAWSILERIRAAIAREPIVLEGREIQARASIGGVFGKAESATDLIRSADEALYQAKAGGRNRLSMRSRVLSG